MDILILYSCGEMDAMSKWRGIRTQRLVHTRNSTNTSPFPLSTKWRYCRATQTPFSQLGRSQLIGTVSPTGKASAQMSQMRVIPYIDSVIQYTFHTFQHANFAETHTIFQSENSHFL